jgi:hypothetical protein
MEAHQKEALIKRVVAVEGDQEVKGGKLISTARDKMKKTSSLNCRI